MTDSFVTQCPHCQTSFRVSHAQLSVARGVVRCGSCLQVFNAARQLLEQRAAQEAAANPPATPVAPSPPPAPATPVSPPPAAPIAPAEPPRAISQKQWTAQELDLDDLDLDEELARLEQREIQPARSFGQDHPGKDESFSARRDNDDDDTQWSGSLFSAPASEPDEIADDDQERPAPPPKAERKIERKAEQPKPSRTEPSLSFDLADLDDEPQAPRLAIEDSELEELTPHEHVSADQDDADEPAADPKKPARARSEPGVGAHDDVLLDLEDDPIHLDWQRRRSPWGKRLLWLLLVLLAGAALLGQYVAYHFDELARQDQYRPWFQQLCPQLGCKVPSKVDIARIKSSNLVVRSHPDFNGALVVDAIIYNRASFSQPFPLLELRFADLNGHLIASRRFKPGEYLGGDLAEQSEMPPQTPIHIALDILDPGAKAVNYSLSFHSPE
ncbi:zinc-ribbon domain/Protein of unknown function (DUF3426) [Pseudomonas asplenii]|uniref:Zinc finger/thioredoxin putative domain-containing protein n=1 Tax=Pseudomonas asplenii TaxID=53407 RepID=A0A0M9GJN7_9PSED|nr:DUF3426 domain-containing protein [Pseudomonas fuscovaginae]KPA92626.1 zinc-ribbon domain/Protein of unknown function (DUF3426) [Pseudomonas fuscovaginae]